MNIGSAFDINLANAKANAALIAAAPEMLEALESCVVEFTDSGLAESDPYIEDLVRLCKIAITKARGGE